MFNIGPLELMVILLVALLVVGPKRLPEMSKTIGKSLRELRKTTDDMRRSIEFDLEDQDETPPRRTPPKALPAEAADTTETAEPEAADTAETAEPEAADTAETAEPEAADTAETAERPRPDVPSTGSAAE